MEKWLTDTKCMMCGGLLLEIEDNHFKCEVCHRSFYEKALNVHFILKYSDGREEDGTKEVLSMIETPILEKMLRINSKQENYSLCILIRDEIYSRQISK